ncbi:MAG: glycosyltransferase family 4 protein [Xanthobacteraceae bacterium]
MSSSDTFRILHVMRTPIGGLFRHVLDLAREQAARGHAVGIIADSSTGGKSAADALATLEPSLKLGLSRVAMSRQVGRRDRSALRHVTECARQSNVDVLHGHGAKGGAYARLAGGPALRVYTPHGGSLFFSPYTPVGLAYFAIERWLRRRTDLALFESEFAERTFQRFIGKPPFARVVHNGITRADLIPVEPDIDAADFIFMGELRRRKGVDVMLDALGRLAAVGWSGRAIFYGEGPDRAAFEARAGDLGLLHQVHFAGKSDPRPAFRSGRLLIVPSRQESLPYMVLEAAAARMPVITTTVGGIAEIFGPDAGALVPPGDVDALFAAIKRMHGEGDPELVRRLHARVAKFFTVETMTEAILTAYRDARAAKSAKAN